MCVLLSFNLYINLIKVKIKRLPQNTRQYMGQKKKKKINCVQLVLCLISLF